MESANEPVTKLLVDAGVDPSEMDPASLEALCEMYNVSAPDTTAASSSKVPADSVPPLPQIGTKQTLIQRRLSDLTEWNQNAFGRDSTPGGDTTATTAGTPPLSLEARLLLKMEEQTQLLLELHQRVDELSKIVCYQRSYASRDDGRPASASGDSVQDGTRYRGPRYTHQPPTPPQPHPGHQAAFEPHNNNNNNNNNVPQPNQQQQQQHPHLVVLPFLGTMIQQFMNIPAGVRNSRMGRTVRLFVGLRRRQVPDLDAGLLFKVLIMAAILIGRLSRNNNRHMRHPPQLQPLRPTELAFWWVHRFYVLSIVVVAGFLIQTGYANFLYNFFIKEDYLNRIWNGEDIDVDAILQEHDNNNNNNQPPRGGGPAAPPRQLPRRDPVAGVNNGGGDGGNNDEGGNANNGNAAREQGREEQERPRPPGWRNALLGGQIPRYDAQVQQDEPLPAPIRLAVELGYLVSSFVLSIFPMWQPQAARQDEAQDDADDDDNDEDDNEDEDDDHDDRSSSDNSDNDPDQLPQVRPPQDSAEYDE